MNNVLGRIEENTALIDFAGPGLPVYKVVISEDHKTIAKGLEELLTTSGHCVKAKDGLLVLSENAATMSKIRFYWMIPYQSWLKKKMPMTIIDCSETLNRILEQCVEQFVMVVGGEIRGAPRIEATKTVLTFRVK